MMCIAGLTGKLIWSFSELTLKPEEANRTVALGLVYVSNT